MISLKQFMDMLELDNISMANVKQFMEIWELASLVMVGRSFNSKVKRIKQLSIILTAVNVELCAAMWMIAPICVQVLTQQN